MANALAPTRLTREELYERVWTEPLITLAPQLGLSDVGLKKTCHRMRVPTPPRGYWAKHAAGQRMKRTPLPKLPASVPPSSLVATFSHPPKASPQSLEEATGRIADQRRYEALPNHRISVPDVLTAPHPLVARSVHLLRKAKPDTAGRLVAPGERCVDVDVTVGSVDRALTIFDALIKALEARGYPVDIVEKEQVSSTLVRVGVDPVRIAIDERVTLIDDADGDAGTRSQSRSEEYAPTGRLTFKICESYLNIRRTWGDSAKKRLEELLNDIVIGIVVASEALREQREEREAREREWRAKEERRHQEEQRRQEEGVRIRKLEASMRAWRKSRAVRDYVAEMRRASATAGLPDDSPVAEWLRWADGYANRLDPTHGVPEVPADPEPHAWSGGYGAGWGTRPDDTRPIW